MDEAGLFRDRRDAGQRLARLLGRFRDLPSTVLGIPRGGVPVAAEVAAALKAPLDVVVARKLGCPWQPELGFGAVTHDGVVALNERLVARLGLSDAEVEEIRAREAAEVARRTVRFRSGRPPLDVEGRAALLVDDGVATGYTVIAGARWLRTKGPSQIVLAVPVLARDAAEALRPEVDEIVAVSVPNWLEAVGASYLRFDQVPDAEVLRLLAGRPPDADEAKPAVSHEVRIPVGDVVLRGDLVVPGAPRGLVVFAHGSGSSRKSPRNRRVAAVLEQAGLATLLLDLLAAEEEAFDEATGRLRFDIRLLADRLAGALEWVAAEPGLAGLPVGLFGASTGAAAALLVAARRPDRVAAVVSRGGRPDLAGTAALSAVRAPTLLLVGGDDTPVLAMNREALARLPATAVLHVVPGATHLFEEPGTLDEVARLAAAWFGRVTTGI